MENGITLTQIPPFYTSIVKNGDQSDSEDEESDEEELTEEEKKEREEAQLQEEVGLPKTVADPQNHNTHPRRPTPGRGI